MITRTLIMRIVFITILTIASMVTLMHFNYSLLGGIAAIIGIVLIGFTLAITHRKFTENTQAIYTALYNIETGEYEDILQATCTLREHLAVYRRTIDEFEDTNGGYYTAEALRTLINQRRIDQVNHLLGHASRSTTIEEAQALLDQMLMLFSQDHPLWTTLSYQGTTGNSWSTIRSTVLTAARSRHAELYLAELTNDMLEWLTKKITLLQLLRQDQHIGHITVAELITYFTTARNGIGQKSP